MTNLERMGTESVRLLDCRHHWILKNINVWRIIHPV
jgi:hypothetical protein